MSGILSSVQFFVLTACLAVSETSFGHDGNNGDPSERSPAGDTDAASNANIITTRIGAKLLPPAKADDVFYFVVYGDRTGGVPEGLKVLEQAVVDTNLLDPDLVMTVGDLIQGYNEAPEWLDQMYRYRQIMSKLKMSWFPVAGNHDIYWRGQGPAPQGHHESNYEQHFGPLWYSFRHKNAGFIVLYSDEGDPATNRKAFDQGDLQRVSDVQIDFLDKALAKLQDADHVFVFLHHPRWIGGGYSGGNWDAVHQKMVDVGNVTAVFAGHIHHIRFDGPRDGIEYYTLATTGGGLDGEIPDAGYLHHLNLVAVRKDRVTVSALPIGAVINPQDFKPEFLAEVALARSIRPIEQSRPIVLQTNGSAAGEISLSIENPCSRTVSVDVLFDSRRSKAQWHNTLDHQHLEIAAGERANLAFAVKRRAGDEADAALPAVRLQLAYLGESARVRLPDVVQPIGVQPAAVPADYFEATEPHCLLMAGERSAVRVDGASISAPDGPLTLEAWVRPSQLSGHLGIIGKGQGSEYAFDSDEGVPQFSILLNQTRVTASAISKLGQDQWTHVAGVFDGQRVMLFVGGKLVDTKRASGRRRSNDLPLYIGAETDGRGLPNRAFTGLIDEVRLSNAALYDADFEPSRRLQPTADTVLLLHFDKNLGPFVLDHSASAAEGILGPTSKLVPVP